MSKNEYPLTLNLKISARGNRKLFKCMEVPIENTSYSKIINSNGEVAVVVYEDTERWNARIASGWSSIAKPELKRQLALDSKLVKLLSLTDNEFGEKFDYEDEETFMDNYKKIIKNEMNIDESLHSFDEFCNSMYLIHIKFIPDNTRFRLVLREIYNREEIEFFNPNNYFSA